MFGMKKIEKDSDYNSFSIGVLLLCYVAFSPPENNIYAVWSRLNFSTFKHLIMQIVAHYHLNRFFN